MPDSARQPILRADYQPPAYLIDRVELTIDLDPQATEITARLEVRPNPAGAPTGLLRLDGRNLTLHAVSIDGESLGSQAYTVTPDSLEIPGVRHRPFVIETVVTTAPAANTELEGLYQSSGVFCTQCEAEGFRKITYYLDRPDVMARFTTTIRAETLCPVLLSNGNLVAEGTLEDGRPFARWDDPFPKPAYLFALVAGNLTCLKDRFVTRSGREIDLRIYTIPADRDKCSFAMSALKHCMKWDEDVYGLEYDLDTFMIVAVGDFNMGAMENKGLNVFNTKYVLARPETATDADYTAIEAVIAHEYFHNWTGNRVTCRDWFQLSLKEGLTVFRDQQFSADMGSAAVKRIADVRSLRASQFPEDASPMAHPVRPDSYIEINNFYTATVYVKGAEVVRMIHTLLGPERFRAGMDLYFQRHDGQAVTCDDFTSAMADASGVDLGQFRRWYAQAGTPELTVASQWDGAAKRYRLTVSQRCPPTRGQPDKLPFHIPLAIGLLGPDGHDLPVRLAGDAADAPAPATRVLDVTLAEQTFEFTGLPTRPVPSLLRGFSAPVKLAIERSAAELQFLMAHDSDPFARWEAGQSYAGERLAALIADHQAGRPLGLDLGLVDAVALTLADDRLDPAFVAQALSLPAESYLGEGMAVIDPDAIHAARQHVRHGLGEALRDRWQATYDRLADGAPYRVDAAAIGRRALKNLALAYLTVGGDGTQRALRQFESADNMTDQLAALGCLTEQPGRDRDRALADFAERWTDDPLVMDKWFTVQALAYPADTLDRVIALVGHPQFDARNPNRARSLIGAFAGNQARFHEASGRGYRFLVDHVLEIDPFNPKVAARFVSPLGRWRRFGPARQQLMRGALERVLARPGLSPDVYEIASKSLEDGAH